MGSQKKTLQSAFNKPPEAPPGPWKVGYARVSTAEQRLDLQVDAMVAYGVRDDQIYVEKLSGTSKVREQLELAIKSLQEGDELVVWKLDRLARSFKDLLVKVDQIDKAGAKLVSLTEGFDTKTLNGRFLLHILGAVAELEVGLTAERTRKGMKAQKDRGYHVGRPPMMTPEKLEKTLKLLKRKGSSVRKVADLMGVSPALIYKHFTIRKFGKDVIIVQREQPKPK